MAKLREEAIKQADIEEYLQEQSDFAFEVRVLRKLSENQFECEHGGIYKDPITQKSRQFDIRALTTLTRPLRPDESKRRLHLSVECKNLRDHYQLLVHCLPRSKAESFHEVIEIDRNSNAKVTRLSTLYKMGEYVAKSTDQIGRRQHDDQFVSNDGDVFEKLSQAVNSAYDLISEAYNLKVHHRECEYSTMIFPVLVVPDNTSLERNGRSIALTKYDPIRYLILKSSLFRN